MNKIRWSFYFDSLALHFHIYRLHAWIHWLTTSLCPKWQKGWNRTRVLLSSSPCHIGRGCFKLNRTFTQTRWKSGNLWRPFSASTKFHRRRRRRRNVGATIRRDSRLRREVFVACVDWSSLSRSSTWDERASTRWQCCRTSGFHKKKIFYNFHALL